MGDYLCLYMCIYEYFMCVYIVRGDYVGLFLINV